MVRPRFSIARMVVFVAVIGLGLAAIRSPTGGWLLVAELLTVNLLLASILGALFRKGSARPFWIGFLVFGWSFAVLLLVLSSYLVEASAQGPQEVLTITAALSELADFVHPFDENKQYASGEARNSAVYETRARAHMCFRICRMALILCMGVLGGVFGRFFASRNALSPAP